MILGFKPQFVKKILSGSKIHSIREDSNKRWKLGMKIHIASGVRTKNYNCFKECICTGIQEIEINTGPYFLNDCRIKVDGRILGADEKQSLAKNDGFENLVSFYLWFKQDKKDIRTLRLIHWTDFKY